MEEGRQWPWRVMSPDETSVTGATKAAGWLGEGEGLQNGCKSRQHTENKMTGIWNSGNCSDSFLSQAPSLVLKSDLTFNKKSAYSAVNA